MSPRRSPPRLDRVVGRREPKKRVLIVCEGEVTEVEYFKGIRDYFRSLPVDIRNCKVVGLGRDPAKLVAYALSERDKKDREARAQRDANIAYDEVWCVVDVNEHKTLAQALITARRGHVNLAVSLPCFELWILYHFEDCVTACDHVRVGRKLRNHIKDYDKHLGRDFPFANHEVARERARRADPEHCEPNRKGRNPSTNAWLVVEVIRNSGKS
ncbi:RloB family protein [Nonomuraea turcica]|uniref:RloB family protein n=1 Tax=Nonomuraea sp. G32 TaxID=3067274 RepID=UPI00273BCC5E|nr:RloB family protein [Nonomuraea sp. G32]MDP4501554.1 RloB family protein [Nonomuraea sp. G32]